MSARFESITSLQNPKVKLVNKLRNKRARDQEKLFVVDDIRDLLRALENGYEITYLFYCPALADRGADFVSNLQKATVYEVSAEIMEKISYRENPSGIVAILNQPPPPESHDLNAVDSPLILGLVNLQKPGNIGALLRTADATGFGTIFLIDTSIDLYNPNIIRSSTGACFLRNVYAWASDAALKFFRSNGYFVVAAHPAGDKSLYDISFDSRTAVILGTEDTGLSDFWLKNCTEKAMIPMAGKITDSLNVSVSGAVFMYEALRQRLDALKRTRT